MDEKGCMAMVTIVNDDEIKQKSLQLVQKFGNRDKMEMVLEAWKQQFADAIRPGAETEEAKATQTENNELKVQLAFVQEKLSQSHRKYVEIKAKERRMQIQSDTLRQELRKRMQSASATTG